MPPLFGPEEHIKMRSLMSNLTNVALASLRVLPAVNKAQEHLVEAKLEEFRQLSLGVFRRYAFRRA